MTKFKIIIVFHLRNKCINLSPKAEFILFKKYIKKMFNLFHLRLNFEINRKFCPNHSDKNYKRLLYNLFLKEMKPYIRSQI
jgi:hypothetical protein